jgi:hypothetical protein
MHAAAPMHTPEPMQAEPVQEVRSAEPPPSRPSTPSIDEQPYREEPRSEPPRREEPRREEPRIDTQQLLSDSGLVMVETNHAKVQIQPAPAEEPQHLGRPRRERAKGQAPDDELVQIETTRK